jgi:nitrous oxidase accessory protein NosD
MRAYKRRNVWWAALVVIVLLCGSNVLPAHAAADAGTQATGADVSETGADNSVMKKVFANKNKKKCQIVKMMDYYDEADGDNYAKALQAALNEAGANPDIYTKVVVPAGKYSIEKTLTIYGNTWLALNEEATLVRKFDRGPLLRSARAGKDTYVLDAQKGGYEEDCHIRITGGTLDGNGKGSTYPFSLIVMSHASDVEIRNCHITNILNGHHIEFGGVSNVTISDCKFDGYVNYYGKDGYTNIASSDVNKEAIQLDIVNNTKIFAEGNTSVFDDAVCKNIRIKNNLFSGCTRGVGTHSAVSGIYYTNILIADNTFENITDVAVYVYNYKNCTIRNNDIIHCREGLDFRYMSYLTPSMNFYHKVGSTEAKVSSNANLLIVNNRIQTYSGVEPGIFLYSRRISSSVKDVYGYLAVSAGNYPITNVTIKKNTIESAQRGIYASDASAQILGNTITSQISGVYAREGSALTVMRNKIVSAKSAGIYLTGSSSLTRSGNKITAKTKKIDESSN